MTAIFKIDQPAGGVWGVARRDIVTGVQVTLEAQDQTHTTYTWEVLSQPQESMLDAGLVNNPEGLPGPGNPAEIFVLNPVTPWIGSFTPNYTSGYLIRLTVDIGMITEDVSVLYLGIRLATSNLALPALTETVFDNSLNNPNYRGWEDKIDAFMKWVDAFIGGGVVTPPGWGRIYVDSVDGSDLTGTTGGNITIPPRRKVTISGRDVVIGDAIKWHINPGWWTAVGLLSTDYPPELFFNGEGTGWQSLAFEYGVVPESWGPSMTLLEPINIRNITPGTVWSGGQRLHMDMVSSVGIFNEDSGGGAGAATGELYFFVSRCWFGGLLPDPHMSIGSAMEMGVPPGEMNIIRIYADQTYFGVGIFSSCVFENVDQCTFHVINRLFDGSLAPVVDGYIGCRDQGPVFRDCEFRDGSVSILYPGYIFGWDGATGSLGEPYGPTFDKVSYRSILNAEGLGNIFEVNGLAVNLDVVVREGEARVSASNRVGVDLVNNPAGPPYVPGTEYPLEWCFIHVDGDFISVPGSPEQIQIIRDGRYRMTITANVKNTQVLVDIVVGLGIWLNLGAGMLPDSDTYISCLGGGGPFLPPAAPNASGSRVLFDRDFPSGTIIEVKTWLHGFFVPAPSTSVEIPSDGATCWIERFE
jgi:hypothetical protein